MANEATIAAPALPSATARLDAIARGELVEPVVHDALAAESPVVEIEHFNFWYGSKQALFDITMPIPRGKVTAIIGPSGCGKSTVLRLVLGLLKPDRGEIRFGGTPVTPASALALRQRVGYVVQDGGLFPHLTARQNALLLSRHLGRDTGDRLDRLAALTKLSPEALARYPSQLSGGQRQRVALIRALMLDPEVLLLDEPLGALDPVIRGELQRDLKEIFRSLGKTVVLVTHDLGEAAFFADRVALLQKGRLVQTGPLADLLERPRDPFVTHFLQAQPAPFPGGRP